MSAADPIVVIVGIDPVDATTETSAKEMLLASGVSARKSMDVFATCLCGEDHPKHPDGEDGCGAQFTVGVSWEIVNGAAANPKVAPPMVPTIARDPTEEADLQTAAANELTTVRGVADSWQKGLAGLLTLVSTVLVLKGQDTFSSLDHAWRILIAAVFGVAALLALGGMVSVMDAAYGVPDAVETQVIRDKGLYAWQFEKAASAANALKRGLFIFGAAVFLFGVGTVLTWFADPSAPPFPGVVQAPGGQCGRLEPADNGQFKIVSDSAAKAKVVSTAGLANLHVLSKCP